MTIWILALVLMALLAAIGYNQGAIRVTASLLGLIVSSWLAMPLSKLTTPVVKTLCGMFSVQNPLLIWALAPVLAFIVVLTLFKVAGLAAHKKVEVFYKYKAGELRLALWERMNKRLGLCLGIVNGLVYTVLISLVFYIMSYTTTQMALGEGSPQMLRLANRMGQDVVATGLGKAVRAIDPMPQIYYDTADLLGLIYHNPLIQGRLSRYPAFLDLVDRPEFQDVANDKDYSEMLVRQSSALEVLNHPKTQAILNNSALLRDIWNLVGSDLKDLRAYLETGESKRFDEPLLGYWVFDITATANELRKAQPNLSALKLKEFRKFQLAAYNKAVLLATPGRKAVLKDVVAVKPGMVLKPEMLTNLEKKPGHWAEAGGKYAFTFDDGKEFTGKIEKGQLKLSGEWTPIVFVRED